MPVAAESRGVNLYIRPDEARKSQPHARHESRHDQTESRGRIVKAVVH